MNTLRKFPLLAAVTLTAASAAHAATVGKGTTGTDLNDGASWAGTAPTGTDTAQWVTGSLGGTLTFATSASWGAIEVQSATAAINITGAGTLTLMGGQTINSVANSGVYIDSGSPNTSPITIPSLATNVTVGSSQTWTVVSGRNFRLNGGTFTGTSDKVLTLTGGGNVGFNANTYAGKYVVTGGTTVGIATSGIGATGSLMSDKVTLDNGRISVTSGAGSVGNRTINANHGITLGAGGGALSGSYSGSTGYSVIVNSIISGAGSLTLTSGSSSGGGAILNGVNTYTGQTSVLQGASSVGATGSIRINGAAGVTIASGATLTLSGTLNLNSTADTITNNGTLNAGGTLNLNGVFDTLPATTSYNLISAGSGTNAGSFSLITGYDSGVFSSVAYSNGILTFTAVPEPSAYGLLGAGALAAAALVRRRKKPVIAA